MALSYGHEWSKFLAITTSKTCKSSFLYILHFRFLCVFSLVIALVYFWKTVKHLQESLLRANYFLGLSVHKLHYARTRLHSLRSQVPGVVTTQKWSLCKHRLLDFHVYLWHKNSINSHRFIFRAIKDRKLTWFQIFKKFIVFLTTNVFTIAWSEGINLVYIFLFQVFGTKQENQNENQN